MPRQYPWEFTPFGEYGLPAFILTLETSEVFVLWRLGICGPMEMAEIKGTKIKGTKKIKFPNPEKEAFVDEKIRSKLIGKPFTIHRTSLLDTIEKLVAKDFIAPINSSQKKKVYSLTFRGLIWYFYHFWNQDAFKLFYDKYTELKKTKPMSKAKYAKMKVYEKIFPIVMDWEKISKQSPDALKELEKSVYEIYRYDPMPDTIKIFNFEISTKYPDK